MIPRFQNNQQGNVLMFKFYYILTNIRNMMTLKYNYLRDDFVS